MADTAPLDSLDDQTTLLILSHLTQELREDMTEEAQKAIQGEDEARLAIASFLHALGEDKLDAAAIVPDDVNVKTVGRGMLELFLKDKDTSEMTRDLIDYPPELEQLTAELAMEAAVILGVLVTWLQIKADLKVRRKDGKTDFEFKISKDATDTSSLKEIAKSIISFFIHS